MQKIVLIVIALILLSAFAIAPTSEEETATANVTVNTFVSITLTDYGTAGINFGSLDPGTNDNSADQNSTDGTIHVRNDIVSNKAILLEVKGTDFTGPASLAVGNAKWDKDNNVTGATTLTTSDVTVNASLAVGNSQKVWSWLSIPSAQIAGSYTSTFSFKGS